MFWIRARGTTTRARVMVKSLGVLAMSVSDSSCQTNTCTSHRVQYFSTLACCIARASTYAVRWVPNLYRIVTWSFRTSAFTILGVLNLTGRAGDFLTHTLTRVWILYHISGTVGRWALATTRVWVLYHSEFLAQQVRTCTLALSVQNHRREACHTVSTFALTGVIIEYHAAVSDAFIS